VSINPNVSQAQPYKLGPYSSPDAGARKAAIQHTRDCVELGRLSGSKLMSMWMAEGTNYPGKDNLTRRKKDMQKAFKKVHDAMAKSWRGSTLLIEYKPFEPAFYHTDIADWGMAYVFCKNAGPGPKSWSTPATTCPAATSSTSFRSCWTKTCSAASTSTTANTPTTT